MQTRARTRQHAYLEQMAERVGNELSQLAHLHLALPVLEHAALRALVEQVVHPSAVHLAGNAEEEEEAEAVRARLQ